MTSKRPARGVIDRPFPQARPSRALLKEDAFMRLHGGWGSRTIYRTVEGAFSLGDWVRRPWCTRFLAPILSGFGRAWAGRSLFHLRR